MDTKNLDAIKRMVVRLQSIKETEWLVFPSVYEIDCAMAHLQNLVNTYDAHSPTQNTEEVRTD